jgi:hypothetical protein
MLWNPKGINFARVLAGLGITDGTIAVTGGTRVFDLFLPLFTQFDLVTAERVTIPDGAPCFSAGSPDDVLAGAGLRAEPPVPLDADVTLSVWRR